MKQEILKWILANEGVDDEDVADHFDIHISEAVEIVEELLAEGLIGFDD